LFGGGSGGQSPDPDPQQRTTGRFCLHASATGEGGPQVFVANQAVTVRYSVDECLSSSCTDAAQASCTVAPNLRVQAQASWLDLSRTGTACTDDCGQLDTLCFSEQLAAGTHVFAFDAKTISLELPSEHVEPICVDTETP
jgi:hypothetical protein